ncbi:histidine ammonia-lyase [Kangiella koreensis]|uniref:Histidine ammonia-lyase n=1 Tax=Kangiella koreensis (strain DSM 16069 / JCM 12317 / KCTC 12182 / SW-125) TaxID=523791 RepID=C7RCF3_KANKD|nr:histidine ammonia-lyase [Kangiella koreensis]ACV26945.1 histidine ammonia-lyase [Kangiella koreensis DSM 16069]
MFQFTLTPGELSLSDCRKIYQESVSVKLEESFYPVIDRAAQTVADVIKNDETVYGINTGFGLLASTRIPKEKLELLQESLVLSHAAGIGELLPDNVVRLLMVLKLSSLAQGHSGVRRETVDALVSLVNHEVYPCIPEKGSVGASGDLAPLAHMSCTLIGVGEVRHQGKIISAVEGLKIAGLKPLTLGAKEGLALLNGTQCSTALALAGLFGAENNFAAAIVAGGLSVDAVMGSVAPFDARIHEVRGHKGQQQVALSLLNLIKGSEINESHEDCEKVQDPYSLRCQPQVMGAALDHMRFAASVLLTEANAVSDNPLVFPEEGDIISGGNFHAEPVAITSDLLAIVISEIGAIVERRIALMLDKHLSGLPAFLVQDGGVNSGFMIAQVTAAALASENKTLAHPASVDSLPTSANQEDHVSMATFAARRLRDMNFNTAGVIAVELLSAAQGIDFRAPLKTSPRLKKAYDLVREKVSYYEKDRHFGPDIEVIKGLIDQGVFNEMVDELELPSIQ